MPTSKLCDHCHETVPCSCLRKNNSACARCHEKKLKCDKAAKCANCFNGGHICYDRKMEADKANRMTHTDAYVHRQDFEIKCLETLLEKACKLLGLEQLTNIYVDEKLHLPNIQDVLKVELRVQHPEDRDAAVEQIQQKQPQKTGGQRCIRTSPKQQQQYQHFAPYARHAHAQHPPAHAPFYPQQQQPQGMMPVPYPPPGCGFGFPQQQMLISEPSIHQEQTFTAGPPDSQQQMPLAAPSNHQQQTPTAGPSTALQIPSQVEYDNWFQGLNEEDRRVHDTVIDYNQNHKVQQHPPTEWITQAVEPLPQPEQQYTWGNNPAATSTKGTEVAASNDFNFDTFVDPAAYAPEQQDQAVNGPAETFTNANDATMVDDFDPTFDFSQYINEEVVPEQQDEAANEPAQTSAEEKGVPEVTDYNCDPLFDEESTPEEMEGYAPDADNRPSL